MKDKKATFKVDFNIEALEKTFNGSGLFRSEQLRCGVEAESLTDGVNDAPTDAELGSTVIVPDMSMMAFSLDKSGVSETDLEQLEDNDGFVTVEYSVAQASRTIGTTA